MPQQTMRAAVVRPPRTLILQDVPVPEPGPGEARVRVRACGICGSDLHLLSAGLFPPGVTPGHEPAGVVDALGEGVTGLSVGQAVAVEPFLSCGSCPECTSGRDPLCSQARLLGVHTGGGLAESLIVPARRLFPAPADLPAPTLALAEPLAVAVHGLRRGGLEPGARVLVLGAGTIGLLSVLAARGLGAGSVWVTARHPHQAELARRMGADRVLAEDSSVGRGDEVDLVVETVGGRASTLPAAIAAARPGANVVVLGMFMGAIELDPMPLLLKELGLLWSYCYHHPEQTGTGDREPDFRRAVALLDAERERAGSITTHILPLEETNEAFRLAADRKAGAVKVSILPTSD